VYLAHFGFTAPPFELTANPKYLFLTPRHSEALANLEYGLSTAKAITLLVGEAGTGKTTLLRVAIESHQCRNVRCVCLNNPGLSRAEFVETLATRFGLSANAAASKAQFLSELEPVLMERRHQGETTALIVDEAQRLSDDLLEEIRLLANIETDAEKLLPLVLAGQPELSDRLNERRLRQLKQRVALRCEIAPFTRAETAAYVASRVRTAGADATKLFTREAIVAIHECTTGIPRTINVVCDNVLLSAYASGNHIIGCEAVREVARDFDLPAPTGGERAADAAQDRSIAPEAHVRVAREETVSPPLAPSGPKARGAIPVEVVTDERGGVYARKLRRFSLFGWSS